MHSELVQRWIDYFCLDTLNKEFDLEYWDCSDFVLPGFHFDYVIERDYVKKIHSYIEFWRNLRCLPKDALISNDVHINKSNYFFHKILSHYFPKINYINFYANMPDKSGVVTDDRKCIREPYKINSLRLFRKVKHFVYKNRSIKFLIDYITHRNVAYREALLNDYIRNQYKWYEISCVIGAKYHINHPDVEVFSRYNDVSCDKAQDKYMVYVDQFFPYHPDIKEHFPNLDIELLAHSFYASLNKLFERVEKRYQCKVIIAAHPLSNFQSNLFAGREMVLNRTAELVGGCMGVLMHSSNALSYAMLFHKPILMLVNAQTEQIDFFNNPIINTSKSFNIPIADMDKVTDVKIDMLNEESYESYIHTYFGEINTEDIIPNRVLLVKYLKQVWCDIYRDEN